MATQPVYGSITTLMSTGLNSLSEVAADSYRQSVKVDNSTDLYMAIDLFVTIITTTEVGTATGYVNVWMAESPDGGTDFSGGASGSDAAYAPGSGAVDSAPNLRFIGRMSARAEEATARTYRKNFRVYDLPDNWSVVIRNVTGKTIASSGNLVEYQGINFTDA
jgi:hypothetical protein